MHSNWPRAQRNYFDWQRRPVCAPTKNAGEETTIISALVILYLTSSARRVFVKSGGAVASHIAGSDWFSALLAGRVVNVARSANLQSKLIKLLEKSRSPQSAGGQMRTGTAHTSKIITRNDYTRNARAPGQINTNGDGRTMEIIIMNDCWKQFECGVCAAMWLSAPYQSRLSDNWTERAIHGCNSRIITQPSFSVIDYPNKNQVSTRHLCHDQILLADVWGNKIYAKLCNKRN